MPTAMARHGSSSSAGSYKSRVHSREPENIAESPPCCLPTLDCCLWPATCLRAGPGAAGRHLEPRVHLELRVDRRAGPGPPAAGDSGRRGSAHRHQQRHRGKPGARHAHAPLGACTGAWACACRHAHAGASGGARLRLCAPTNAPTAVQEPAPPMLLPLPLSPPLPPSHSLGSDKSTKHVLLDP